MVIVKNKGKVNMELSLKNCKNKKIMIKKHTLSSVLIVLY
jgi:hypothetical protein